MIKLALAASAALTLCACATTNGGPAAMARDSSAGARYCWQDRLVAEGAKLTCNWAANPGDACRATALSSVEVARYTAPRRGRFCENGQWLVEVAPAG